MKVFLTGGTGFIGQPLTKALLARGWRVTAFVRRPDSPQAKALIQMGAECYAGNVTDRESMRPGMSGADVVVHNAGHYEYGMDRAGQQRMRASNVTGTENVLGLALELDVPRVVYVSTTQAFGDSGPQRRDETFTRQAPCRTTYEQSKTEAHAIARQYQQRNLPLVIVCPNGVIGANDHSAWGYFLRLYLNKLLPPFGWAPDIVMSLVHVNDLAEGIALAAEKGRIGETYVLAGEPKTNREHIGLWALRPGAFLIRVWVPTRMAALSFGLLEPLQRRVGLPAFMSRETVVASATHWHYASDKAQRELGWTHRSAQEMWLATMDGELELLANRKRRSLVSRLQPVDAGEELG